LDALTATFVYKWAKSHDRIRLFAAVTPGIAFLFEDARKRFHQVAVEQDTHAEGTLIG
jgi:hypothetical protein